jgi:hypothetical protein
VSDSNNNQIKKLTLNNGTYTMSIIAGNQVAGYSGDGGGAHSARLNNPSQLVVDLKGNIYVADRGNSVVRKLTLNADGTTYTISTFVGTGTAGFSGDGGPANKAQLSQPVGLSFDAAGNLYIADAANSVIRRVSINENSILPGNISTIAGTPDSGGYNDNKNIALGALLLNPHLISIDDTGNIYIGDCDNHRIRKLSPIIVPEAAKKAATNQTALTLIALNPTTTNLNATNQTALTPIAANPTTTSSMETSSTAANPTTTSSIATSSTAANPTTTSSIATSSTAANPTTTSSMATSSTAANPTTASIMETSSTAANPTTTSITPANPTAAR